ncbi:MAG: NADH-quinone oxidoreductase subunit C [Methanospirillum sp.]|uniref:NADH-quinone oxidoreductase subunit C n=1 Tax=Methanospirillum sp. TaxID=45200 RepID=UPI00236D6776|nr:NADH-quinone oxidoreductase subunit C [Methanospirillum sp.]MDD1730176.1 NADH-quinone oxidoreductase subunit C [Methanospirillum sp.]
MRKEEQDTSPVTIESLASEVQKQKDNGARLVQIGCARVGDEFNLYYSFESDADRPFHFVDLKLVTDGTTPIGSITGIYFAAFTYENEIADLYGLQITGNALDFKGTFITTSIPHPFGKPTVTKKEDT